MDIFHSRFYRLNVILLSMIGLWPYQKSRLWQLFQQIMCQVNILTLMTVEVIKLYEIWGELDIMIECITPIGVLVIGNIKAMSSIVHKKNMIKLLEKIKTDWSSLRNEKEIEILMNYTEQGRKLTILYTVCLYSCVLIYGMIPLMPRFLDVIVPLNESRPPVYLYHTQYYVDPEEYFIWICLHTYAGTAVLMTTIIAADTMFACYVMHVCGILDVIGHRLENLTLERSDTDIGVYNMSNDDDERYYREIVLCIDQHYQAIEVVKIIESSYSISYLLVFGVSVILLSISAVQLLIRLGDVGEMIRLFQLNFAQCNHLLFNSWPCQRLIDQSIHFRESLYATKWYSLSEGNKNLIRFTMLRTLEPQKITAGKIYVMSIENFGVVIKTSISYFTVFASVQ